MIIIHHVFLLIRVRINRKTIEKTTALKNGKLAGVLGLCASNETDLIAAGALIFGKEYMNRLELYDYVYSHYHFK